MTEREAFDAVLGHLRWKNPLSLRLWVAPGKVWRCGDPGGKSGCHANAEWHVQVYDEKLQRRVRARLMIPFPPTGVPAVEPEYTVHRDGTVHGPYQPNAPDGTPYDEATVTWPTRE